MSPSNSAQVLSSFCFSFSAPLSFSCNSSKISFPPVPLINFFCSLLTSSSLLLFSFFASIYFFSISSSSLEYFSSNIPFSTSASFNFPCNSSKTSSPPVPLSNFFCSLLTSSSLLAFSSFASISFFSTSSLSIEHFSTIIPFSISVSFNLFCNSCNTSSLPVPAINFLCKSFTSSAFSFF